MLPELDATADVVAEVEETADVLDLIVAEDMVPLVVVAGVVVEVVTWTFVLAVWEIAVVVVVLVQEMIWIWPSLICVT